MRRSPDADGEIMATGVNGYMQTIAMVVLDQGGNIMKEPNDMFVVENAQPDNDAAKEIAKKGNQITSNEVEKGQAKNGVFYDAQIRGTGKTPLDIMTNQDATVRRYFGPKTTDFKEIFKVTGNKIHFDDNKRKVTFTPGQIKKL